MQLSIIYFAALAEKFPPQTLTLTAPLSVAALWQQLHNTAPPTNVRVAINHSYVAWDFLLTDDAEIAFFPPVTGG